jgi:hypothetical protein
MRVIPVNVALYKWADTGTDREFIVYYSSFLKKFKKNPQDSPVEPMIPGIMRTVQVQSSEKNKKRKDHFGL